MSLFAVFCPGPTELCIIAGIAMLLLGPTMVPKVARSIGSIIPSFKAGLKEVQDVKAEFKGGLTEAGQEIGSVAKEAEKAVVG